MERRDGRLVIFSVGPDPVNDHGAFDPKRWTNGGPDDVGSAAWDVARRQQHGG
jgi:hypothetical protein